MLNKDIKMLKDLLEKLNYNIAQSRLVDISEVLGNRKKFFFRSFFSGIFKGIGIGIGVTLVTAIIVLILQRIIKLNIPIISEYITDIVEIVEKTRIIR